MTKRSKEQLEKIPPATPEPNGAVVCLDDAGHVTVACLIVDARHKRSVLRRLSRLHPQSKIENVSIESAFTLMSEEKSAGAAPPAKRPDRRT
jgi:hypothetical protein